MVTCLVNVLGDRHAQTLRSRHGKIALPQGKRTPGFDHSSTIKPHY